MIRDSTRLKGVQTVVSLLSSRLRICYYCRVLHQFLHNLSVALNPQLANMVSCRNQPHLHIGLSCGLLLDSLFPTRTTDLMVRMCKVPLQGFRLCLLVLTICTSSLKIA